MKTLVKADIVKALAKQHALPQELSKAMVQDVFDAMSLSLEQGQAVKLSGFGNFVLLDKPSRPGQNLSSGESTTVAARRVVTFRPGNRLKQQVGLGSRSTEGR